MTDRRDTPRTFDVMSDEAFFVLTMERAVEALNSALRDAKEALDNYLHFDGASAVVAAERALDAVGRVTHSAGIGDIARRAAAADRKGGAK